jgi:hypothetical protein
MNCLLISELEVVIQSDLAHHAQHLTRTALADGCRTVFSLAVLLDAPAVLLVSAGLSLNGRLWHLLVFTENSSHFHNFNL